MRPQPSPSVLQPVPPTAGGVARAKRALTDRRGMSAALFGVAATALLGMSALATEAGLWYLSLRQTRNAADAAAMAGASIHWIQPSTVTDANKVVIGTRAARQVATANGYTQAIGGATVTVNSPPTAGTLNGVAGAYEVIISQTQMAALSRVVTSVTPTVTVRAVAGRQILGEACVLALGNGNSLGLDLQGNFSVNSPNCIFASNLPGPNSIERQGNATMTINGFQSVGGCSGCTDSRVTAANAPRIGPATQDPFADVQNTTTPNRNQLGCRTPAAGTYTATTTRQQSINNQAGPTAFCSNNNNQRDTLQLTTSSDVLDLAPGVYYFYNVSLIANGGSITCSTCATDGSNGVTLVFTGSASDKVGTISMNSSATIRLSAARSQPDPLGSSSNYNGVVIYRDDLFNCASGCNGNWYQTNLNGTAQSCINGGIYMPTTDMTFNGTFATNTAAGCGAACNVIVANSVDFSGNVTSGGCTNYGTNTSKTYAIRLVE